MSILNKFQNGKYKSTHASSFWLNDEFVWQAPGSIIDYTKLAATQRAIGNFVNIVTGKTIPVVFQSNDESYTDGQSVTIGTKLDGQNFDPAVGLALHEGSHIAYTDFNLFKTEEGNYARRLQDTVMANIVRLNGLDPDLNMSGEEFAIIKDLLNWIEDRRIDYKVYTTAPGYRVYYESMYNKYFNDSVIDKALTLGEKQEETLDDYMFHIINLTNPNRKLDSLKKLREIWDIIDLKNIQRLNTTTDSLSIACFVYKSIKTALQDQKEQDQKENKSSNNKTGSDDSDNDSGNDGNESGSDSPSQNQESTSQLTSKELHKLQDAIQKQKDFIDAKVDKRGKLTKAQKKTISAMKEAGVESRPVSTSESGNADICDTIVIKKLTPAIICSLSELFVYNSEDFITGKCQLDLDDTYGTNGKLIRNQNAITAGIVLGKQLGNKLQLRNSEQSLKTTRLETGKIDRRLISQLGYNNANIFHRIITDKFKNYFIHISIDASGSMHGNKFANAIKSAVAIAQAASMTSGIRVQISFRGTSSLSGKKEKAVTIYAYDSAHDKMSKINNMFKYLSTFGCTPEGIAFKSIEKDIKSDSNGCECIFINYSDGAPTSVQGVNAWYDGISFTKKVINGFREIGINIISYYITEKSYESERAMFIKMYGADAKFIAPNNMVEVAKTLNNKFLEIAK